MDLKKLVLNSFKYPFRNLKKLPIICILFILIAIIPIGMISDNNYIVAIGVIAFFLFILFVPGYFLSVRDYIRMREDAVELQKMIKQKTGAFCLRHGFKYDGNKWTVKHLKWLEALPLSAFQCEILNEYLIQFRYYEEKIAYFDRRIEELASEELYKENAKKLRCFIGIDTNSALSLLVEIGDFNRFNSAKSFSAYVGLVPGEDSSSESIKRLSITKAGNKHARTVFIEAAQSLCRGRVGAKSKRLLAKQRGNDPNVIAYADRANERLRRKYYRMVFRGKHRNDAVTAVARELSCFVWGMLTNNIA